MSTRPPALACLAALVLLSGCLSIPEGTRSTSNERRFGPTVHGVVIEGDGLRIGTNVLDSLVGRVGNLQIRRGGGSCPELLLRGTRTFLGSSDPAIYVDGTRAVNTCILEQVRTIDVDRVEVYPSGIAGRPGYFNHPNGLILIFTRTS